MISGSVLLINMTLQGIKYSYFNNLLLSYYFLGEMDDVLDNICPLHYSGSIYRYVSMLVSDLCDDTAL